MSRIYKQYSVYHLQKLVMKAQTLLAVLALTCTSASYKGISGQVALRSDRHPGQPFCVYDNMFYRGKPDTAKDGLMASNILYENRIWPDRKKVGLLPKHDDFTRLVSANIANPGPLVIDVESLPLTGDPPSAHAHMEVLATLASWAHLFDLALPSLKQKLIEHASMNLFTERPSQVRIAEHVTFNRIAPM